MPVEEPCIVVTHSDCVCNEVLALTRRHQAAVPVADRSWTELLVPDDMVNTVEPWSRRRVVEHYGGAKRAEFERAYESILSDPLENRDGKVRMFLKADKYDCGETFGWKPPRCIQFRQKRYGLELGRFVHPIESDVYGTVQDFSGTSVFAKARNGVQRAQDLLDKSKEFADPVYLLLDQSNWDAHVNKTLLRYEHNLYMRKCNRRSFKRLLDMQLHNSGSTKNGTRYETPGTRMSGDMNTALGNCVINYGLMYTWSVEAGIRACFYIDGDDSVIVLDKADMPKVVKCDPKEWFLRWGMESKVEWASEFESCEFCQSRPVWDGLGWRMVRNPARFLSRSSWTVLPHAAVQIPKLVSSIARCELACGLGIPVVQPLALKMLEAGGFLRTWRGLESYRKAQMEYWHPDRCHLAVREVTAESRASFEKAWGICPERQRELEEASLQLSGTTQEDWDMYLSHFAGDNVA